MIILSRQLRSPVWWEQFVQESRLNAPGRTMLHAWNGHLQEPHHGSSSRMRTVMQVSVRRASGLPQDPEPSDNVVSFVRALAGLQVPPDVVLRAEELTDPGADMRRLLRCIMFLKNSEEVTPARSGVRQPHMFQ